MNEQSTSGGSSPSSYSTSSASSPTTRLPPVPPHAHRIVLMRHGESEFNNANIFTGWCDVALTPRGVVESVEAGEVLRSLEVDFRKCYASLLTRSIVTAHRCLEAAGVAYTPLVYDWRFNERHYGALQGLSKERTAERLGRAVVMDWRRSYWGRPPPMTSEHPHYAILQEDVRYKRLHQDIPLTESLQDCQLRVVEGWKSLLDDVRESRDEESDHSLLVAHANTLRALVMHLDDIAPEEIEGLNIATGLPFYYDIDKSTGRVVSSAESTSGTFRGIYISDERKKRNFLERRRAANDPWLWALYDHQVTRSMLVDDGLQEESNEMAPEGLEGLEAEARHNTEVFAEGALKPRHDIKS